MYVLLPSYNGSEEGDDSPTSVLSCQLVYMCCTYNSALNGRLYNVSCQGTNVQMY